MKGVGPGSGSHGSVDRISAQDAVSLATDVGSEQPIRAFLVERDISYPVGRASSAQRRAFGGIPGIPTTFIIDRDGVIRHRIVGYFAPPALRAAVSRLAPPTP